MITILTIISMLVIAAYTAAVCVKTKGVPYSISATITIWSINCGLWQRCG